MTNTRTKRKSNMYGLCVYLYHPKFKPVLQIVCFLKYPENRIKSVFDTITPVSLRNVASTVSVACGMLAVKY